MHKSYFYSFKKLKEINFLRPHECGQIPYPFFDICIHLHFQTIFWTHPPIVRLWTPYINGPLYIIYIIIVYNVICSSEVKYKTSVTSEKPFYNEFVRRIGLWLRSPRTLRYIQCHVEKYFAFYLDSYSVPIFYIIFKRGKSCSVFYHIWCRILNC